MATIFGIGTSGLLAYQQALTTVGHNVANANTEGYSRQRVNMATRTPEITPAGWMGNGVDAVSVQRFYDDFVATQIRSTQSAASKLEVTHDYASRLDDLLADPDAGLDPAIQDFFNALQELSDYPGSAAARQVVLAEAEALADRFVFFDRMYDQLRQDILSEMGEAVAEINALAANIADINDAIVKAESDVSRSRANDLLDQREVLLNNLSKLTNVQTVEQDDGAINVMIGTGQPLVVGTEYATLSVTANASNPTSHDISLSVGSSSSVVITSQLSGGKLSGLLDFRSEYLDDGQSQLGKLAVGIVEVMNDQHVQGVDLLGQMGGNFFSPLTVQGEDNLNNTGTGAVSVSFSADDMADLTSSDYTLVYNGGTSYTLTRLSDSTTTAISTATTIPVIDGFQLAITAGAVAGDSFLIRPTRDAAGEVNLLITDTNLLAAAGALRGNEVTDANGNPVNTGTAAISSIATSSATGISSATTMTLTYSANADGSGNPGFTFTSTPALGTSYILYDPATESAGKDFPDGTVSGQFDAFGGLSFHINGTPVAGDQFVVEFNSSGSADNRNALAMGQLQTQLLMNGGTTTFQGVYGELVSDIGSKTRLAEINLGTQEGLLSAHTGRLQEISGVNLDEEAANLARFQQAYQAAAQVIQVANTVFDSLLNAVRA
ncbi:MAG: flagellar hook-associated protein FlgK [Sedimenticola sp.]